MDLHATIFYNFKTACSGIPDRCIGLDRYILLLISMTMSLYYQLLLMMCSLTNLIVIGAKLSLHNYSTTDQES